MYVVTHPSGKISDLWKNLRPVSGWMREKAPNISIGARICDTCRKKLSSWAFIPDVPVVSADTNSNCDAEDSSLQQRRRFFYTAIFVWWRLPAIISFTGIGKSVLDRKWYSTCGKTPITKRKLRTRKYMLTRSWKRLHLWWKHNVIAKLEGSEIIRQLKEKFQSSDRSTRVRYYHRVGRFEKLKQSLVCQISWLGLPRS